jgi:hypothetical protein
MLCYVKLCYVMLCNVMICYVTSCHIILDAILFHLSRSIFFFFSSLFFILLLSIFYFYFLFLRLLTDVEEDLVLMCIDVLQGNQLDLIKSRKSILSSKFVFTRSTFILMLKT